MQQNVHDMVEVTGGALLPDHKALLRLRQACRIALERYVDVASLNSGNLSRLTPLSVDDLGRANLALLKRKEERAHQVYLDARDALLKYVMEGTECRNGN
jgi:hypothetical protein